MISSSLLSPRALHRGLKKGRGLIALKRCFSSFQAYGSIAPYQHIFDTSTPLLSKTDDATVGLQTKMAKKLIKNSARFMSSAVPERSLKFKKLAESDIRHFESILTSARVHALKEYGGSCDKQDLDSFNTDFYKKYKGNSPVVIFPTSTAEVSEILKYCNQEKIAVVPQGGNTGVVGGSTVLFDEVIINMSKMNKIRSLDADSGALVCDAGCVLEQLDTYISDFGFIMPLDLGAKGSCHIGGNISTNAGGIRYLRYGSLHGSVLGVEVVLPNGNIINNLSTLQKDSTGYDLKQIFIGAEGTLGIVTGVSILAAKRPIYTNAAVLGFKTFDDARNTFISAKKYLSEILSAFEFWDSVSMNITLEHFKMDSPLSDSYPFYALIETGGSNNAHDQEKLISFLEKSMDEGFVMDGVLARDKTQVRKMWILRDGIGEAIRKFGVLYGYDISIPIGKFYDIIPDVRKKLEEGGVYSDATNGKITANKVDIVIGYGHIGDGNLHLNVMANEADDEVTNLLEPYVHEWVSGVSGSVSAEHGLGFMKRDCLKYSKSPEVINLMRKIKNIYDPNGIMNPYKFLPED